MIGEILFQKDKLIIYDDGTEWIKMQVENLGHFGLIIFCHRNDVSEMIEGLKKAIK